MKKLCFSLAFFLLLAGCAAEVIQFVPDELASALLDSGAFTDLMTKTDSKVGCYLYELPEDIAEQSLFYFSSGATAEELAVFKARSAEDAKTISKAIEARIKYQADSFADYEPSEVPKLNDAVLITKGVYVVFYVVSDYPAAATAAEAYI